MSAYSRKKRATNIPVVGVVIAEIGLLCVHTEDSSIYMHISYAQVYMCA